MTLSLRDLLANHLRKPGEQTSLFEAGGPANIKPRGFFMAQVPQDLPQDRDLWFGLNVGGDAGYGRTTIQTITRVTALHADLDVGGGGKSMPSVDSAMGVISTLSQMLGTRPVAIILSGHGYQPVWAIDHEDVRTGPDAVNILKQWGALVVHVAKQYGGHADAVFEPARLVRAPGSVNWKRAEEPIAAVAHEDTGRPLSWGEIAEAIAANPVPADEQHTVDSDGTGPKFVLPDVIRAGERYPVLFRLAASLRARGVSRTDADLIFEGAIARCESPETFQKDPRGILADAYSRYEAPPPKVSDEGLFRNAPVVPATPTSAPPGQTVAASRHSWDDMGNAERMHDRYAGTLRWVADTKEWFVFEQGRWVKQAEGGPRAALYIFADLAQTEADLYSDVKGTGKGKGKEQTSEREDFLAWAASQRYQRKADAAAATLRQSGVLSVVSSDFNTHPMLLNVANGTVDLQTGQLLPALPEQLLSQQSPVDFDMTAEAPMWEKFLAESMPDLEMRNYLQRIMGYTLTGAMGEQVMFIHHGDTQNGKSVFLKVFGYCLGTYAQNVAGGVLTATKSEQHPANLIRLEHSRMGYVSELPVGARLDQTNIKRITGGDPITARGMGENFREFEPIIKLHLAVNDLPHFLHEPATARRLHLVHWSQTVPDEKVDKYLAARIIANELPGVLAWAVRGTQQWSEHGLARPFSAVADVDDYVADQDDIGQWLEERTTPSDTLTSFDALYRSYRNYMDASGLTPLPKPILGRMLKRRGVKAGRTNQVRGWYLGLVAQMPSHGFQP